jgi:hypothetical protein
MSTSVRSRKSNRFQDSVPSHAYIMHTHTHTHPHTHTHTHTHTSTHIYCVITRQNRQSTSSDLSLAWIMRRSKCDAVSSLQTDRRTHSTEYIISFTCKRGNAKHWVKDDPAFPLKHAISGYQYKTKTPQRISMKFCTIQDDGEFTRCVESGWNRSTEGAPTDRWNITSRTCLTVLLLQ